ncbi:MAG: hypothetical protein A3I12_07090 [Gammaproteobacteria bacterium RIFCSPLOWO2_02_FULL_38_11]|nr:MAG: hypothetical protein A3B69_01700 [Gammaproteobacteria bacterium RIFCSPHIGHO2_02_FULL_38_33]OGT66770.1 MAG: hypothetical protein A3I12_07090 [Gammaproteobacteria bacterium RIFCSPLOWO2_02_FULL_38_11]
MSTRNSLKKIGFIFLFSIMVSACSSFLPSNYLGSASIRAPQKINNKWVKPKFIEISPQMLSTEQGRQLLMPLMKPKPYCVGAYDNLDVIVWGHPEFSTIQTGSYTAASMVLSMNNANNAMSQSTITGRPIVVDTDGSIFYPYIGRLHVAGKTLVEIQTDIAKRLSRYLRDPQVTVQVSKFRHRNIYVLGEVGNPGLQALTDKPLSIMEALSFAGNIKSTSADPTHIYLIRGSYTRPDVFWLSANTPQSLIIAEQFPLQENDILYVSSADLSGFNTIMNQILPPITTLLLVKNFSL